MPPAEESVTPLRKLPIRGTADVRLGFHLTGREDLPVTTRTALVAGAAFLAVVLIAGALVTTAWAVPDAIAAVLGVGTRGYPFQTVPVLVGIAAHLTVSMILGVGYLVIARRLRLRGGLLVLG